MWSKKHFLVIRSNEFAQPRSRFPARPDVSLRKGAQAAALPAEAHPSPREPAHTEGQSCPAGQRPELWIPFPRARDVELHCLKHF